MLRTYRVSTYGKWEVERVQLVINLLSDAKINTKVTEAQINEALFTTVISAMINVALTYVNKNYKMDFNEEQLKNLTMNSYLTSLTVILPTLSNELNIEEKLLAPHINKFCTDAEIAIKPIFDDVIKIGKIAIAAKTEALEELYGNSFKMKHKKISPKLIIQDKELVEISRKIINNYVKNNDFGEYNALINEQVKYLNEIAPRMEPTAELIQEFQATFGMTMEEYKATIKKSNHPFWQQETPSPVDSAMLSTPSNSP